jgi:hypothetical protein
MVVMSTGPLHILAFAAAVAMTWYLYRVIWQDLRSAVRQTSYDSFGIGRGDGTQIAKFTSAVLALGLLTIVLVAFLLQYAWWLAICSLAGYLVTVALMSRGFEPRASSSPPFPINGRERF